MPTDEEIAQNPETPADDLRAIYERKSREGHYKNPFTFGFLAQNPNTPPDLLQALLLHYPEAVAKNPILPLLPLEKPDFWRNTDEDALLKILRLPDVPTPVLEILASGGSGAMARQAARFHVGLFGEIAIENWQNAARDLCRVWPVYLLRPALLPEQTKFIEYHEGGRNQLLADWVEIGLLPASFFPNADLPKPIPHARQEIDPKRAGAIHVKASSETLHRLAETSDDKVLIAAILHPNTTADTLRVLLDKKYQNFNNYWGFTLGLPVAAARHPNADADLLRLLAGNGEPIVRRLARRHQNAPPELTAVSRQAVLNHQSNGNANGFVWHGYTEYAAALQMFLCALHTNPPARWVSARAKSANPIKRLAAVLYLHKHAAQKMQSACPDQRKTSRHEQNRWNALKNDANAVVRAAANAPITPDFDFVL